MKKSIVWKMLFGVLTTAVLAVFSGCVDDNDDMGAPYLTVKPETLALDAEGRPADEFGGAFVVETNRPWRAKVEEEGKWLQLESASGTGNATVKVAAPQTNKGRSAKVTFEVYNSYGPLLTQTVTVTQGEVVPPALIFRETAGSESVASPWPMVADYKGWTTTGEGAGEVSYEGSNTSIRSSGKSNAGAYEDASGPNTIFFGGAPASFTVKNIALKENQTDLRLTFGGSYYNQDASDNIFKTDEFEVSLSADGVSFVKLPYTINDGDKVDPFWVYATANFTLKEAVPTLYIRFATKTDSSHFRMDDPMLMTGNGGQVIDLKGGGDNPGPEPGEAVAVTIPELNARMTEPMKSAVVLDPDKDYWFEAVVMNDVAGGNYSYNNLILATENASEAGNGITCYGSQVEPSKLNLNRGDKVRVTLLKGLAKYQNYNGMYELTGDKDATWCTIEKLDGQAAVKETVIAPADLAKYQGMAVTIENASVAQAGVWANSSALSKHTFTAGGASFTVFCKKVGTDPMVFADVPFKAATGSISGLAAVNSNAGQLVPRDLDDVAAFAAGGETPSVPAILSVAPETLSFTAGGGEKTVTVVVENKGDNLLSVSGLTAPLSATVDNDANTVTVTAAANSGEAISQTLTIALAGGNSKTVAVTQEAGQGGGEEPAGYVRVTSVTAGKKYLLVATKGNTSWVFNAAKLASGKVNGTEIVVTNGVIESNEANDACAVTIESSEEYYTIQTADGKYVQYNSGTNLTLSDTATKKWAFDAGEYPETGTFLIKDSATLTASTVRALLFQTYGQSSGVTKDFNRFGGYSAKNASPEYDRKSDEYLCVALYELSE